jgi:hypothetical protein
MIETAQRKPARVRQVGIQSASNHPARVTIQPHKGPLADTFKLVPEQKVVRDLRAAYRDADEGSGEENTCLR